jgi:DNA repair exonuclease SbcCD ATPase subunit
MTVEERFERIEHITAALVEERRKDREEYRQLWRDARQAIADTQQNIDRLAEESRAADARLEQKIDRVAEELRQHAAESRAADQRSGERIDSLVSAVGKFLAK